MKLNLDFTGATLLKEWWQTVKANFEAIQSHSTETVIDHPDKSVTSEKIADYAVKTMKLANESVSAGKIATDAVRTTHLKDGNVTRAKLASEVQTQLYDFQEHIDNPSQEIADEAVTRAKLSYDTNSDFEKMLSTAEFINALYGCRVFLWTKNEITCPNENFPNEHELYENNQVVDEDFTEDVWYLYKHDGTFSIDCLTFIGYETKTYYGLNKPFGAEGVYALKFYTTTPAQGTVMASGTCEVIKLTEGDFEKMISGGSSITVDSELSSTSENPVQNKVVNKALNQKMDWECDYLGFNNMDEVIGAIVDLQERVSALEG
ncbi:MAG: hypothetical protein IJX57_07370 [Clostridia bacterium]|nr:hypothetical protein [Clostridia bacterium]